MSKLTLYSAPACPSAEQVLIALSEKQLAADVVSIDPDSKPDWFLKLAPLGKVPVLKVSREGRPDAVIFESGPILDYLEDVVPRARLLPSAPLERARMRAWMQFGASFLVDLRTLGTARTTEELASARAAISSKLKRLESTLFEGPYFSGQHFSLVDVVFAPAFRQIDVIESVNCMGLLDGYVKIDAWRRALASRPSVAAAAPEDFSALYLERLRRRHALVLKEAA